MLRAQVLDSSEASQLGGYIAAYSELAGQTPQHKCGTPSSIEPAHCPDSPGTRENSESPFAI